MNGHADEPSAFPIIDFSAFAGDASPESRIETGKRIVNAYKTSGFIYLVNHGILPEEIDTVFKTARHFFEDLPVDDKLKLSLDDPEANRGYLGPGRERVAMKEDSKEKADANREATPDIKESFEIGKEPHPKFANKWPEHMPEFRSNVMPFWERCHELHLKVLDAIALGFELPSGYFTPFADKKDHNLRVLYYPEVEVSKLLKPGQARIGAHTDYGTLTLLFQDSVGGLQVQTPQGDWVDATPIPGSIVVNAGDLLARWSNDIIKSNPHRVMSPSAEKIVHNKFPLRQSVAFFCNPNFDATITVLDPCVTPEKPAAYPPVSTRDYLVQRLSVTY
ncbi:thymine dioxygenase [Gonapodya prolifera JEL478]|uniref:Thymine dioxygenase n=1 Tax=Gonapodya prolifera (strain JEL478) TaxID=1344416 RepID=A0A139ATD7_GONPJ|nr:thymine dioxygenase [Gonapodya prolifera JEL478]|eukprot:KXS19997.1 thymine dioxygenase [Gonapodya prolifera JEL478]